MTKKSRNCRTFRKNKSRRISRKQMTGGESGEKNIFFGMPINFEEFQRITGYRGTEDQRAMNAFLKSIDINFEIRQNIRYQYILGYQIDSFSNHTGQEKNEDGKFEPFRNGFKNIDELISELTVKRTAFQTEIQKLKERNPSFDKVKLYAFEGLKEGEDDDYEENFYRDPEPYIFNLRS